MKKLLQNKYTFYSLISVALATVGIAMLTIVTLPANAQTVSIDTTLDRGDGGPEVTELQAYLATDATLYPQGLVTGYYGPLTEEAVMRFQCRFDIVCSGSAMTTGYGRVGPVTMSHLNSIQLGVGGPELDNEAPIIGADTVTTTSSSANVNWNTSEDATHRVMYSTTFPFLYSTAPDATDAEFDQGARVTITGLSPNTTYYYVKESVDLSGNVMWTSAGTFTTN